MPSQIQNLESAAKSRDLTDLLDHLAWTDVLKPALDREKSLLSSRLTSATLGTAQSEELTPQQLAGMYYGIDRVTSIIEKILRQGGAAEAVLREVGLSLK
jgi:hypothetical protein